MVMSIKSQNQRTINQIGFSSRHLEFNLTSLSAVLSLPELLQFHKISRKKTPRHRSLIGLLVGCYNRELLVGDVWGFLVSLRSLLMLLNCSLLYDHRPSLWVSCRKHSVTHLGNGIGYEVANDGPITLTRLSFVRIFAHNRFINPNRYLLLHPKYQQTATHKMCVS